MLVQVPTEEIFNKASEVSPDPAINLLIVCLLAVVVILITAAGIVARAIWGQYKVQKADDKARQDRLEKDRKEMETMLKAILQELKESVSGLDYRVQQAEKDIANIETKIE